MKKIFIIFLISVGFVNCSDDYVSRNSLTDIAEGNFWQSESDAFLALNGVYASLQSRTMYGGNLNGFQGIPGFDGFSDNCYNSFKWEGPGEFMEGVSNPANGALKSIWVDHYRGIARANKVIKNVKDISLDLVPQQTKNALLGQAYFLRALMYFNLAVYYEDVPLILEPQLLEDAFVPKNTYAEITAQIIEDLKFASDNLPVKHPDNLYGYATKGAALALFARVQLYNKEYTGQYGVIELTNQIMGLGYALHPNYAELFTEKGENSAEVVFAVRFLRGANTSSGENFSATFGVVPKGDMRPMPNLVNSFLCTDGKPITTSPLYSASNKGANRDPRANASVYFKGDQWLDEPVKIFPGAPNLPFGQRKYIRRGPDADGNSTFGDGSQDFHVIRYADVLLMRAEAMAETNDINGARDLVNQVRARVGMPTIQSVQLTTITQPQMIAYVRQERRFELAFEGLRFMDIKRWNDFQSAFQRAQGDNYAGYNPSYQGRKSEVFPIPQDELDVNPKLVQHPVWQ